MDLQMLLLEKSCLETSRRACRCVTCLSVCWHVLERCWRGGGKSSAALCSLSPSRLSLPAASRHAPIAPDCLIGTFQVRGPNKPGQSTQTVIHLFGSRRCSCPLFLRSPRGVSGGARVIWGRGRQKINDKWLCFFHEPQQEKNRHFYVWSSYWPTSWSIIQSRLRSKKEKKNTIKQ